MPQPPSPPLEQALQDALGQVQDLRARLGDTRSLLDAISEAIYVQDAQGRFLDVNEGALRMYGHPRDFLLGQTPEVVAAPGRNDFEVVLQRFQAALGGTPGAFEFWGLRANGEVFPKEVRVYPGTYLGQPVVIAVAQDITGRKRAENLQRATYLIADAALQVESTHELFRRVHDIIRELMPAENFYIALWDKAADRVSFPYWVDAEDPMPEPRQLRRGLTEFVLRHGEPLLLDAEALLALEATGEVEPIGSLSLDWLGVPLRTGPEVFGALVVQSYEGGHRYSDQDRDLLAYVSGQVAMAIERSRTQAAHRLLSTAMDAASDPVFSLGPTGRFEFVNQAACRSLGYARKELLALSVWDVDPDMSRDGWAARWALMKAERSNRREVLHRHRNGSTFPVEITSTFLTVEGQERIFTHTRDISERKAAEAELRASEEKFARAFEASPDAININALDGTYLAANEAFTQMSGWTLEEALGRTTLDLGLWADPEDRVRMQAMLQKEGRFAGLEAEFRMKDGSLRTGLVSGALVQMRGETCLLTVTRDITDRKEAESAVRYSEDKFSRAFHASPDAINLTRLADGTYLDVSEGFEKISGWSRAEAIGKTALELNIWGDPRDRERAVALIRETGEYTGVEFTFRRKDGALLTGLMSGKVMDVNGEPCLLSVTRDITERKASEAALRQAEQRLRTVLAHSQAVIYQLDAHGRFLLSEGLGLANLGLKPGQMVGQNALEVYRGDRETLAQLERSLAGEASHEITRAGGRLWDNLLTPVLDESGKVESVIGIATDVTDRLQLEEALRQSQKLESLGVLAGGIAHDFNNLLTAILGNLNLAQMHLGAQAPAQPYLARMEATVLRATELTKQMLAYSGRGHFQVEPRDLNQVVKEVTHLLEVSISKKVHLRFDLEPELPAVQADAAQLQQVIMNLVTNASDAIGDQDGVIRLRTHREDLDAASLRTQFRATQIQPGPFVLLEVEDTGCGMESSVLERIFDPFFSTKESGRGLGLSAMQGILRGHGAGLHIESEPGRGTCFRIAFPAAGPLPVPPGARPEPASLQPMRGRVLLVDDEDMILETTGAALRALGLQVVLARDGREALERFRKARGSLDAVLMDLTMPRMDGREAFRAMHEEDPGIPVILSSGFTERDSLRTKGGEGPSAFIQKPYQLKELALLLQRLMKG